MKTSYTKNSIYIILLTFYKIDLAIYESFNTTKYN